MATAVQVESLWNGLTDNNGQPLGAGKVYTYSAGTTTPVSLYTSSDKSTSATNPLILDANGKAQVWADGRYKFVVKTSADVTLYTLDNLLYGFDDTTVLLGGTSTGSANAQTVSVPATVESYANGQRVTFVAGYTNTGATTLQFNSLSAISIVKGPSASALQAGDIVAGQMYACTYFGGSFYLENYPTLADVQRSRTQILSSVSGTNTIIGQLTPAPSAYELGLIVRFKATATNSGAVTLNVNSLGAKTVQWKGQALTGGEIQTDAWVEAVYDGTVFQILNHAGNATSALQPMSFGQISNGTTTVNVGGATTTSLSTGNISCGLIDLKNTGTFLAELTKFSADANPLVFTIAKSRGATTSSYSIVSNNDGIGRISFSGANGTGLTEAARIYVEVDGTPGASGDMPGRLIIATSADGSGTPAERVRFDSSGRVAVNGVPANPTQLDVTSTNNARRVITAYSSASGDVANPAIGISKFDNDSTTSQRFVQFWINNGATQSGGIAANGASQAAFVSISDARLKTNIVNLPSQLANVMSLRPVEYDYKDGSGHQIGFIAQEVQAVYPDLISQGPDGFLNLSGLGRNEARLIKAFQEFAQVVEARVTALEARIAALEA